MIKDLLLFFKILVTQKKLIISFAKRDFASNYVGSLLGFIWALIRPLVTIFVFWAIFSIGFKVKPVNDVPFAVWLTAGMAAWFVFADIVSKSTSSVIENSMLIKKTLFPSSILPVVKALSCLIVHAIFLSILIVLIILESLPSSMCFLQFFYYLICMIVLALGLGWGLAALQVFLRDTGQIVEVLLQLGFWTTPIFWDLQIMPVKLQKYFMLNPMYYVVQGYRDSFLNFTPFWQHPYLTIYFWCVTLVILLSGIILFNKLRPHFADTL
jgi:ABC-type polysaccharide/polyol phosphate export permease